MRLRREYLPPRIDVTLLACGFGGQVLFLRRRRGNVRHRIEVVAKALSQGDNAEHRDVVRVEEGAHREPRRLVPVLIQPLQQRDRFVRREGISCRSRVLVAQTVRLRADPLRRAVGIEQVRLEVCSDVLCVHVAVFVQSLEITLAVGRGEVRVRDVPFAFVESPVAASPEPVPDGGDRVGREPEHFRAVGALCEAIGLRDAVQRRVLARHNRCAAGGTGRRHGVVTFERDARIPQTRFGGKLFATEAAKLIGLVHRRMTQLIGHDDKDVRLSERTLTSCCLPAIARRVPAMGGEIRSREDFSR